MTDKWLDGQVGKKERCKRAEMEVIKKVQRKYIVQKSTQSIQVYSRAQINVSFLETKSTFYEFFIKSK